MPYCSRCGAELPKDAGFCPSCGTAVAVSKLAPSETHRTFKVKGTPKVVVTNTAHGSIEVKSGPRAEVIVDLDLRLPEELDWSVLQEGNIVSITCRSRESSFFFWSRHVFSEGPRANILLSVPADAELNLENRAGRISVTGVKGAITAESSAGLVNLKDCECTVRARTKAGSVYLENVNGTISARTAAGSITYTGALGKGENWFLTRVGSIDLMLKGEPDLTVEASAILGKVTCIPEPTDGRYERGRYRGRFGAGTGRLIAETRT